MRLQMAGCMPADAVRHRRPGPREDAFSVLHYTPDGVLACVESVNLPQDHMAARKLLEAGRSPQPHVACDPAVALKSLVQPDSGGRLDPALVADRAREST
jgi:3-phenylpropionate/trans-cinnamate dioxygenase ferredoxin reductase subunit